MFTGVLDHYDIEYETEKCIPSPDTPGSGRRMDVHIPKTDTAIELKTASGNLETGIGQALNYTRSCKEAILILGGEDRDAYRPDIHKTCRIAPAMHFAMVIPNPQPQRLGKAGFHVMTDSRPDLFSEMKYNTKWDDDMIVVDQLTPGYQDYASQVNRWHRPGNEHSLNEYMNE
ncbi:MAG: hypothetical protein J07HQX50_01721 [Haloquadratum sp. J07HQX50]|nr:MAG: hypothetical protein J07HQX50_01721 [Haloquadratum sp. J07HQX50]